MTIQISEENLIGPSYSAEELLVDFACFLYSRRRISLGKASRLAKLDRLAFQKALADRDLYINYDEQMLKEDLESIKRRR